MDPWRKKQLFLRPITKLSLLFLGVITVDIINVTFVFCAQVYCFSQLCLTSYYKLKLFNWYSTTINKIFHSKTWRPAPFHLTPGDLRFLMLQTFNFLKCFRSLLQWFSLETYFNWIMAVTCTTHNNEYNNSRHVLMHDSEWA